MSDDPRRDSIPVVVIVGSGRTGSTLLGSILGSVPGVFAAGELRFLWERGLVLGQRCGCGESVARCPIWHEVVQRTIGFDRSAAEVRVQRAAAATRIRHLPRNLWLRWRWRAGGGGHDAFREDLDALYRTVQDVTGADLIVDTSKLPPFVLIVDQLAQLDLRLVHLVRRPTATAFSWLRVRRSDGDTGETMERFSVAKSTALWSLWNSITVVIWGRSERYLQVRYEDLMAEPRATLTRVAEFVGIDPVRLPLHGDNVVHLQTTHQVAGNVNRLRSGPVELRDDDEWRQRMSWSQRTTVAVLAAPARALVAMAAQGPGGRRPPPPPSHPF